MKNVFRKIFCMVLCMLMVISMTACANDTEPTDKDASKSSSSSSNSKDSAKKAEQKDEQITLTLWHIWTTDTDQNKATVDAAIAKFQEDNPNIKLEVDATETEAYKTKLKTAIAAGEAPDLFFTWGGGFSQPFVDAGKVLELDSYLNDGTKDQLLGGAFTNQTYDGKIYGVPFMLAYAVLYCNEEMFDQNGLKMPDTYDELLTAVAGFREKGIVPMSVAEKDMWPGMFHYNLLALREGGSKLSLDALTGKGSFDQDAFINAAAKLDELVKAGAFDEGCMGLNYDQAMAAAKEGTVPMIIQGSWAVGGFEQDDCAVKGKIVGKKFPAIPGADGKDTEFLGGAVDCWMGSANTKHPEATALALKQIAQNMSLEGYKKGMSIPVWKADSVDESQISPLFKQVKALSDDATGFVMWWDTFLGGEKADTHLNLVAQIYAGNITPEEFAKEMQKLNEK